MPTRKTPTPTQTTSRFKTIPQQQTAKPTAVTNGQTVGGGGFTGRGGVDRSGSGAGSADDGPEWLS
jgi:hypothetical protein